MEGRDENLQQKKTINFPRNLTPEEASRLFKYLSYEVGCEIRYAEDVRVTVGNCFEQIRGVFKRETVKIAGQFTSFPPIRVPLIPFDLTRVIEGETSSFGALRFFTTPGYELNELDPLELGFMDRIREGIEKYFAL